MLPHATEWTLSRGISLSFYGFLFMYDGVYVLVKITHRDKSACEIRLVGALAVYTHLKTSVIIIYTLTQTYGKLFLYLFNLSSERVIRNMMKYKYIFILHFEICHCVIKKCIQWLSRYTKYLWYIINFIIISARMSATHGSGTSDRTFTWIGLRNRPLIVLRMRI